MRRLLDLPSDLTIMLAVITHVWVGLCMVLIQPFPLPFSTMNWFASHGGLPFWGAVHLVAAALSCVSLAQGATKTGVWLLIPQQLIMLWLALAMGQQVFGTWDPRTLTGAGYIIPLSVAHTWDVFVRSKLAYVVGRHHHGRQ